MAGMGGHGRHLPSADGSSAPTKPPVDYATSADIRAAPYQVRHCTHKSQQEQPASEPPASRAHCRPCHGWAPDIASRSPACEGRVSELSPFRLLAAVSAPLPLSTRPPLDCCDLLLVYSPYHSRRACPLHLAALRCSRVSAVWPRCCTWTIWCLESWLSCPRWS